MVLTLQEKVGKGRSFFIKIDLCCQDVNRMDKFSAHTTL